MCLRSVHSRPHCGRRIGVISAITRQIGRMRPTVRPTRGRRIAADYERHNAFLVFTKMRPTRGRRIMPFIVSRNAAYYEPTFTRWYFSSAPNPMRTHTPREVMTSHKPLCARCFVREATSAKRLMRRHHCSAHTQLTGHRIAQVH